MDKVNPMYILIFFATFGLSWFAIYESIFYRLKKYHFATYQELGEPNLFRNSSHEKSRRQGEVLEFLAYKKYLSLNDPKLNQLCKILKIIKILYFMIALAYGTFYVLPEFYYIFLTVMNDFPRK